MSLLDALSSGIHPSLLDRADWLVKDARIAALRRAMLGRLRPPGGAPAAYPRVCVGYSRGAGSGDRRCAPVPPDRPRVGPWTVPGSTPGWTPDRPVSTTRISPSWPRIGPGSVQGKCRSGAPGWPSLTGPGPNLGKSGTDIRSMSARAFDRFRTDVLEFGRICPDFPCRLGSSNTSAPPRQMASPAPTSVPIPALWGRVRPTSGRPPMWGLQPHLAPPSEPHNRAGPHMHPRSTCTRTSCPRSSS